MKHVILIVLLILAAATLQIKGNCVGASDCLNCISTSDCGFILIDNESMCISLNDVDGKEYQKLANNERKCKKFFPVQGEVQGRVSTTRKDINHSKVVTQTTTQPPLPLFKHDSDKQKPGGSTATRNKIPIIPVSLTTTTTTTAKPKPTSTVHSFNELPITSTTTQRPKELKRKDEIRDNSSGIGFPVSVQLTSSTQAAVSLTRTKNSSTQPSTIILPFPSSARPPAKPTQPPILLSTLTHTTITQNVSSAAAAPQPLPVAKVVKNGTAKNEKNATTTVSSSPSPAPTTEKGINGSAPPARNSTSLQNTSSDVQAEQNQTELADGNELSMNSSQPLDTSNATTNSTRKGKGKYRGYARLYNINHKERMQKFGSGGLFNFKIPQRTYTCNNSTLGGKRKLFSENEYLLCKTFRTVKRLVKKTKQPSRVWNWNLHNPAAFFPIHCSYILWYKKVCKKF